MNIERELNLINFSYYLKANPSLVQKLAIDYYAKFLIQQDRINDLEQNCQDLEQGYKELETEKASLYAELESLRIAIEQERYSNDTNCNLHLTLPSFLSANPHHYLQP